MSKKNAALPKEEAKTLENIKKFVVTAMVSDDELFENLVLKGGNAIDLINRLSSRASIDLDFSMKHDFPGGAGELERRVDRALRSTFKQSGYEAFDIKMQERPANISEDMADFWGGYGVEFKLISSSLFAQYSSDIGELRKHALKIGQGQKFLIDISRFEYTDGKQEIDFDGYRIYVYSPEMIVCEKLRAVCQQMPEYGTVIKRSRAGSARARDFLDIYILVTELALDIASEKNREILAEMFKVKKVPLSLLGRINDYREFHRTDFPAVQATVKPDMVIKDFDTYFDFTLGLADGLKTLWNV